METAVYLDHNATTPLRPEAAEAVTRALTIRGNPSSVHRYGRLARKTVEDAREAVAAMVGASSDAVVFTSGGTEANNLAIAGSGRPRVLVSAIEHASVLEARADAEAIPVTGDGAVDLDALEAMLAADSRPALVSVMLANNETGVLQPVASVSRVARSHGALVHCDAVQAAGKVPLNMAELGVDLLTLSGHKVGAPTGVGALVFGGNVAPEPVLRGGGQERRRRAGTENISGIAAFGAVAADIPDILADQARLASLRDGLEQEARRRMPESVVIGAGMPRVANTSCLAMPGVDSERQVMVLDLAGVAISAGSACSSGKVGRSHVLDAMGLDDDIAGGAIRISLGWTNHEGDVERFLDAWTNFCARTAARGSAKPAA